MRRRTASTSNGTVNRSRVFSKGTLVLMACALGAVWVSVAFTQELLFAHGLGAQAQALSRQNAQLTAANQGYAQDIADVASGAAAEEEARQNGYARSDEKVYLISQPAPNRGTTSPSPVAATPHPKVDVTSGGPNPIAAILGWVGRHL